MLTRLFCDVDDFYHDFIPEWETQQLETGVKKRRRKRSVSHSEIITIIISYHRSGYRAFKWFYQKQIQKHWNHYFPTLPSYHRFIELMPDILIPLRNAVDKLLLRKRSIIETINDQLKNIANIEHSRDRSLTNCMINVVAGLVSYTYQEKKPARNMRKEDLLPLL